MRRRLLAVSAFAIASILLSACGSGDATAPAVVTSLAGTWNLTSVNGKGLPYVLQAADPKLEILAKQFVITSAGTFTSSFSVRATDLDGTVTLTQRSDAGTLTLADNVVTIRSSSDGTTVTGGVSNTTMTIVTGDFTQIFTKQ